MKVRIMAADTWHFSFYSLPRRGTSSYFITVVHWDLEMCVFLQSFYLTVLLNSMYFWLLWHALGPKPRFVTLIKQYLYFALWRSSLSKFYMKTTHYPLPVISEFSIRVLYVMSNMRCKPLTRLYIIKAEGSHWHFFTAYNVVHQCRGNATSTWIIDLFGPKTYPQNPPY